METHLENSISVYKMPIPLVLFCWRRNITWYSKYYCVFLFVNSLVYKERNDKIDYEQTTLDRFVS
jgi:hypothetical protein